MQHKNSKKIKVTLVVICLFISLLLVYVLERKNIINLRPNKLQVQSTAKTTSTADTAQENFTDGDNRVPTSTLKQEGTMEDSNGAVSTTPPENQWKTSVDKAITVFSPSTDASFKTGSQVSGKSVYPVVSFRLIDDVQGVLSQGNIKVVNGKYAGVLNFSTQGKLGRLDIFSTSSDGTEKSNVEIQIRF